MTSQSVKIEVPESSAELVERARQRAQAAGASFAGLVYPSEAWELFCNGSAVLIDVRTAEERKFVGRVPDAAHVAWKIWPGMTPNENFVQEVEAIAQKEAVVMLLCRSGVRSVAAAEALAQSGYANAFNVLEGFEGDLDSQQQRGKFNGWRYAGLAWIQD